MAVRRFRWGDVEALSQILGAISADEHSDLPSDAATLCQWLGQPGLQPHLDCFVAEVDGQQAGYAVLIPEIPIGRGVAEVCVHPRFRGRGLGRALLAQVVGRARALRLSVVHLSVTTGSQAAHQLLSQEGFAPVRVYSCLEWIRDGSLPPVHLPQGYALRSFQPGEEGLVTRVQNAAFGGSWGFCPNTVPQIAFRIRMSGARPEGIIFISHQDEIAAYCWTQVEGPPGAATGRICMTGVVPGHRGLGLGKAVVVAGMDYLLSQRVTGIRLAVDRENAPAQRIYRSLGYQLLRKLTWYELRLS